MTRYPERHDKALTWCGRQGRVGEVWDGAPSRFGAAALCKVGLCRNGRRFSPAHFSSSRSSVTGSWDISEN